jgi:hypothetical protein
VKQSQDTLSVAALVRAVDLENCKAEKVGESVVVAYTVAVERPCVSHVNLRCVADTCGVVTQVVRRLRVELGLEICTGCLQDCSQRSEQMLRY